MALALAVTLAPHFARAQTTFVVKDVRLFDGERVSEHRSVRIGDGVIAQVGGPELAVPTGARVVDGRGRTLLPGLIDAHVHLSDSTDADLRQALSLGVTTVLDMWNGGARLERIKALRSADPPDVAAVRTAGVGATAPGGHPSQMGGGPFPTIADSADAQPFVDARIAEGSDYLKIIYDDLATLGMHVPMLDRRTLQGLVAAAHARGKLAVVHILSEAQARDAIDANADGLAHLFTGATVSSDFASLVAKRGAFVVPTLTVLHGACGRSIGASIANDSLLRPYIRPSMRGRAAMSFPPREGTSCSGTDEAVRQLARAGVPLLTGTDAPAPGQTYGASLHGELELLVGAGLTPIQALTAATSAPARAFRLTDRGRVAPGLRADLMLVQGDPTTDILATRRIVMVWKRGVAAERARYVDPVAGAQEWSTRTPLPQPTGVYMVGTDVFHVVDSSRATSRSIRSRPITVQRWYPARTGTGTRSAPYLAEPALLDSMVRDGYLDLKPDEMRGWRDVRLSARLGARASQSPDTRGWPVVVFSHGFGVARAHYSALAQELASHGYVVLAIDHPIGGYTLAPDGRLLRPGVDSLHYPARPLVSIVRDWAIDDALVVRRAAALGRRGSPSVATVPIDTGRVAAIGHSLGGAAALQACLSQPLFHACADMDGAVFGDVESSGAGKPILVLLSEPDQRGRPPARDSADTARRAAFARMGRERDSTWTSICALQRGAPCFVTKLLGTGHFSFSDAPFQIPSQLRGVGATLTPPEMQRAISERLLDFLDHVLRGTPLHVLQLGVNSVQVR